MKSVAEIDKWMKLGSSHRTTKTTLMNDQSSRSHSVFCVKVETSETLPDGKTLYRAGKLNLVDLAGSERQAKTGATVRMNLSILFVPIFSFSMSDIVQGMRLVEATKINLSLSALGNVINALSDGNKTHIPYRDSRLTFLLQDSLGGNAKTVMIANIGPVDYNYEETMNTLRYASRTKQIINKPKINEDPKDAVLRVLKEEKER